MMTNIKWKIINATSGLPKDIVVIHASVDSDKPAAFYYDQQISILPFVLNDGCLAPGESDEIVVPGTRTDEAGNDLPVTFIIAEAQTLAPIQSVTFKSDLSDLEELTITDASIDRIERVFDFNKNITALPASALALAFARLDFTDARAIEAYFAATKNYKTVELDDLCLIRSYYNALPYGWANGKDTFIYLYSEDCPGQEDGDIAQAVGWIKITNNWLLPLPLFNADHFRAEIQLQGDTAKRLFFSDGTFYDTEKMETAVVRLAGSFMMPDQISTEYKKTGIVTFLPGKINDTRVFGIAGEAPDGEQQKEKGFWNRLDVQSVEGVVLIAVGMMAIGVGIAILVKLGQFVKWYKTHGNPAVPQVERDVQTEALKQYLREQLAALTAKIDAAVVVPQQNEIPAAQQLLKTQQLELKANQAKDNIRQMADAQSDALKLIADKYVSADIEIAFDDLDRVAQSLENGNVENFDAWVEGSLGLLNHNTETIVAAHTFIAGAFSTAESRIYKESMKVYEDVKVILENNQRDVKEIDSGADEREIIEEE